METTSLALLTLPVAIPAIMAGVTLGGAILAAFVADRIDAYRNR